MIIERDQVFQLSTASDPDFIFLRLLAEKAEERLAECALIEEGSLQPKATSGATDHLTFI